MGKDRENERKQKYEIYFQPKISLTTYKIVGAETIIRWKEEKKAEEGPTYVLPYARSNEHMVMMDFEVMEEIAMVLGNLKKRGVCTVPISLRLTAEVLKEPDFLENFRKILRQHQLAPEQIEFEISEVDILSSDKMMDFLIRCKQMGFLLALYQVWTVSAVISKIAQISFERVTLSREVLERCQRNQTGREGLQWMIKILKIHGVKVACEGVENGMQAELLKKAGCDWAHGNRFCMPLTAAEFEKMLVLPLETKRLCQ